MAVQIYSKVADGYKLNVDGLSSILSKVGDLPVAIYSICGPLRQGKSFLLSVFVRYLTSKSKENWIREPLQNFFKYRNGGKPETTGIYVWAEPFILKKGDGSRIALLLLDSQGSFDAQTTMEENAIVFSLCSFLSSHLIFNLKHQIREDMLQFLQLFAGFGRLGADENTKDEPFQKLLFLVRDFEHADYPFGYYDDEVSIDGKNFKKNLIDPQAESPTQVRDVHKMIVDTFASVGVYLMPHPGQELARNGNFDLNKVDPEFVVHLEKLTCAILNPNTLLPKVIGGQVVTGSQLKVLIQRWAYAFSQKLPDTKTVFEATAEAQHEIAKKSAVQIYSTKIKEFVNRSVNGVPDAQLYAFDRQVVQDCISHFQTFKKIGNSFILKKYLDDLAAEFPIILKPYDDINRNKRETAAAKAKAEADRIYHEMQVAEAQRQIELLRVQEAERQRLLNEEIARIAHQNMLEQQANAERIRLMEAEQLRQQEEARQLLIQQQAGRHRRRRWYRF